MPKESIYDEYFRYTEQHKKTYGENTFVLIQIGKFYEVYAYKLPDGEFGGVNLKEYSKICELHMACKTNTFYKGCPVYMCGFITDMIDKYLPKLEAKKCTVPVYDQAQNIKNTTRHLKTIYSCGTFFSSNTDNISNNIACLWLHKKLPNAHNDNHTITIGCASIDIFTGKTNLFEYNTEYLNSPTTFDEAERFITTYTPKELLLLGNLSNNEINNAISYCNVTNSQTHLFNYSNEELCDTIRRSAENVEKQNYQMEVLKRFYDYVNEQETYSIVCEYPIANQAFCFLLDFVNTHNPHLVLNIDTPLIENRSNRVILGNHTLQQLNIIGDNVSKGKYSSVLTLLNQCKTTIGKRKFEQALLKPSSNAFSLTRDYEITEHILVNFKEYSYIETALKDFIDLEKTYRKIIANRISPSNIVTVFNNIEKLRSIYLLIVKDTKLYQYICDVCLFDKNKIIKDCDEISKYIENVIDFTKADMIDSFTSFETIFIHRGVDSDIDTKEKTKCDIYDRLVAIKSFFNDVISRKTPSLKGKEPFKVETKASSSEIVITGTKARTATLKSELASKSVACKHTIEYVSSYDNSKNTFELSVKDIENVKGTKENNSIVNSAIKQLCDGYNVVQMQLKERLLYFYEQFINGLKTKTNEFRNINELIGLVDVIYNRCFIANKFNYCKPEIPDNTNRETIDKQEAPSFFDAKDIRHCLIEHIQTEELYVTNDVCLGKDKSGILLYGTNAVGKTSLIRAIGITIIMAQAGLYVPCSSLVFYPYKNLFSRILGNDNLFKGLSTFAVEMSELRSILKYSNENSLILGDELCSGTEIASAVSIFVTGIQYLHANNSSFIFATHLHEIVGFSEVKELERLALKHMSVKYDNERKVLVFDRKLLDGPGNNMYGLEVCKSYNLPKEFLEKAHKLRIKYDPTQETILKQPVSSYNARKIRGNCEICNVAVGEEVHHLQYQCDANDNGYINANHKNHVANLCSVCSKCHDKIHKENKRIQRKKTTGGFIFEIV